MRICDFIYPPSASYYAGLNPYLTLNTANSGTILIDLAADDKEFQSVVDEVLYFVNRLYYIDCVVCMLLIGWLYCVYIVDWLVVLCVCC